MLIRPGVCCGAVAQKLLLSSVHSVCLPSRMRMVSSQGCPSAQQPNLWAESCVQRRLGTVCMAHPRRIAKVASQIQREIGAMFANDPVLSSAIAPERAGGSNDLSAIASITDVYVSNDLQIVKIYVSIYSDERGKQKAMERLKRLEPYVRGKMGSRVVLHLTPEYRFEYDDSIEEADLVQKVIGKEDVARFQAELAQEAADMGWGQDQQGYGDGAAGRGDEGFFKSTAGPEADAGLQGEEEAATKFVKPPKQPQPQQQKKPRPAKLLAWRNPFDDMFGGDEDGDLVQDRSVSQPKKKAVKERQ